MDLQDFVQQTITQIVEGMVKSEEKVSKFGGKVNPQVNASQGELGKQGFLDSSEGVVQIVNFDVALTVTEGTGTKGGIGIFAGMVNLGSTGQSNSTTSSISHVKFSIPLRLPK